MVLTPLEEDAFSAAWPEAPVGPPPPKRRRFGLMRELPVLIVVALTLALLIKTFLIQAFFIPSASMEPTLHGCDGCTGDRVLVNKLAYRFREPKRGEIVVFVTGAAAKKKRSFVSGLFQNVKESLGLANPTDVDFIKRIIGLPGETVEIKTDPNAGANAVYITPKNGKTFILKEPYIQSVAELTAFGPFKVAAGRYFLMGDNRANSSDSRINNFTGICPAAPCAVPKDRLVGKAFVRIFPFKRIHVFQLPLYGLTLAGAGGLRRRRLRSAA